MKVRNIAFFGVMASILSVGYANAADATVIASKAYADTKEATANKKALGSATWSTITDKDSEVKFPTMKVLNAAVQGAIAGVTVDQTYSGTSTHAQAGVAIEGNKEKTSAITGATAGKLATVGGVQADVQYMKGTGLTNHMANADATVISQNQEAAVNAWNATITAKKADDKIPTLATVEARISGERAEIDSALSGKQATIADVSAVSSSGKAITSISQTNGKISASTGEITLTGIASSAKATSSSNSLGTASSASDSKLVTEKAVATALGGKVAANSAITASGTTNKFVQYDAKGLVTAGVDAKYKNIDSVLYDINSGSAATCSAANPCVLSYIGDGKYKWTNMDIDGLPVNTAAN